MLWKPNSNGKDYFSHATTILYIDNGYPLFDRLDVHNN